MCGLPVAAFRMVVLIAHGGARQCVSILSDQGLIVCCAACGPWPKPTQSAGTKLFALRLSGLAYAGDRPALRPSDAMVHNARIVSARGQREAFNFGPNERFPWVQLRRSDRGWRC